MNIDEYRAMVEREKEESSKDQPQSEENQDEVVETPEEKTTAETPTDETTDETNPPVENSQEQTKEEVNHESTKSEEPPKGDKIVIDGVGEVSLDDVKEWQKGYLRTQDYTRKTQEVAQQRKEAEEAINLYNYLKANPHIAEDMLRKEQETTGNTNNLKNVDPSQARVSEMEQKMYDMMLQLEIRDLQDKYDDFEVREVLTYAQKEGLDDLEKAYRFNKAERLTTPPKSQETQSQETNQEPAIDAEELKKQLRAEILADIEKERESTQTIISSNDSTPPSQNNDPVLSDQEKVMAQNFHMTFDEYAKWRDKK